MLRIGTWNVRGLTQTHKQLLLKDDCERYQLDLMCLQETKCTVPSDQLINNRYRLIIMEQKDSRHGGLGFVISPKTLPWIKSYNYVSDRVAFLDLLIPNSGGGETNYRVINAYGPTQPRALSNPELVNSFYQSLQTAFDVPSRYEVYFGGDFNAKIGKLTAEEISSDISYHVGRHGIGTRNSNGESLLDFIVENKLFVCNTAFQHPSRHITTRTGWLKDYASSVPNSTKPVYSQIDYVLCRTRSKRTLCNARSYAGASLSSDHKIVVATISIGKVYQVHREKPKPKCFNVSRLTGNTTVQRDYTRQVNAKVNVDSFKCNSDPANKMRSLMKVVKDTALDAVGVQKPTKNHKLSNDSVVVRLSEKRKDLRLKLNHNFSGDRSKIRAQINRVQKEIQHRLKALQTEAADHLVNTISSTDESRQMFEAVRELTNSKSTRPITVHNEEGNVIATDSEKAEVIRDWFEKHFTGDEPPLEPFVGVPRPLDTPITQSEVESAVKRLKNNRACGPDGVPNELLKYAGENFCAAFSTIVNQCFETNSYIDAIGESILTPLQKPGKPVGPVKNLRPLNLLNGVRKIMSVITLGRIQEQVNQYTGPWQCGYKAGHGCTDIVWSQKMLISVVMRKQCHFHKMGIDMTSAFDTIKRSTILRLLEDAGCSSDDLRLCRLLLSRTSVVVRVNSETSTAFLSTKGAFQGDSLSGCFFTLSLAGGLNQLRVVYEPRPIIPVSEKGLPLEWEYADDVDFCDEEEDVLRNLLPVCTEVLSEWGLNVNESKTEFVHLFLASKDELDHDGKPLKDNEPWRSSKSLGSLLCSVADIKHRIVLANSAFQIYKKVWLEKSKIPLAKKLIVYEAQVVSVLLYNCACWSAPKHVLNKLDTCVRKHLRTILNIKWPTGSITNRDLYQRCNTVPITERVRKARWTFFGHVLRMDDNCPPVLALRFAVTSGDFYCGRRGRPRINLLSTIQDDLKEFNINLKSVEDLEMIRMIARNRSEWRNMFNFRPF